MKPMLLTTFAMVALALSAGTSRADDWFDFSRGRYAPGWDRHSAGDRYHDTGRWHGRGRRLAEQGRFDFFDGDRSHRFRSPLGYVEPGTLVSHRVPLYPRIRVKDRHNIAPFAVPRVVAVRDPAICDRDCRCCEPRCVYVTVYVPPGRCERVKVKKHGREVKLDYGKYEVEVEVEDGYIEIDYDD